MLSDEEPTEKVEKKVSERDLRRARPASFRFEQNIACWSSYYGHFLRKRLYDGMVTAPVLSSVDLVNAGKGFKFDEATLNRFVPPLPLPKSMYDRFIALWIQDSRVERLMHESAQAARELALTFYPQVYWNAPPNDAYHVTVFHFSQYEEHFALPMSTESTNTLVSLGDLPTGEDCEMMESQKVFAAHTKFKLVAHDVVLTKTGNVLVLWHAKQGNVDALRAAFKARFPNTPVGQTERIMHSTLVRFVLPEGQTHLSVLTEDQKAAFQTGLREIGEQIIGTEVEIDNLMYSGCHMYYDCSRFRHEIPYDASKVGRRLHADDILVKKAAERG